MTTLFVTHDQQDAFLLADKIIVMNKGKIEQIGTPLEVYTSPKTGFVAKFVGKKNVIPAVVQQNEIHCAVGTFSNVRAETDGEGIVLIDRSAIRIGQGSHQGKVISVHYVGDSVEVQLKSNKIILTAQVPLHFQPKEGENVSFSIDSYQFLRESLTSL